jgi:hypothetical protein
MIMISENPYQITNAAIEEDKRQQVLPNPAAIYGPGSKTVSDG